jgi:uncharacterized repeat protein (TIGR01451 family)
MKLFSLAGRWQWAGNLSPASPGRIAGLRCQRPTAASPQRSASIKALPLTLIFSALLLPLASANEAPTGSGLPAQPLAFEPNQGQTSHQVSYLARGKAYMLFLEPTEAVLSLDPSSTAPKVLRMRLVNAAPHPRIRADTALPGRHNYYIGNEPKRWHTGIPTYAKVVSANVYPGIDMVYRGQAGQLEYDFTVAPHADPHAIRLAFAGNDSMTLNGHGDLILNVGGERVVHRAPYAYQTLDGTRVPVAARYAIEGKTVSFKLGRYDASRPLIIDPALIYASYLGGTGDDEARAVAVDASGNIYITGQTASTDLPYAGNFSAGGGTSDAFVTKFDSSGAVVFSTYIGSGGSNDFVGPPKPEGLNSNQYEIGEKGNAIAISSQGRIYITGGTAANVTSNPFPTLNPYQPNCLNYDAFVSVLNNDPNDPKHEGTLYYSTCVGGGGTEEGLGITVDSEGAAYVVGYTTSNAVPYFPHTNGALQAIKNTNANVRDSFFFKLNPGVAGTSGLIYSTYLGSGLSDPKTTTSSTYATAVAVDANGDAYVAGWTQASATELPSGFPTTGAYQTTNDGAISAFVYKIDPTTSQLLYGTFLGGSGIDKATGIALDDSGNIYVAGQTTSSNFPLSATPYRNQLNGSSDGFVAEINPASGGSSDLLYATYLGGTDDDGIQAIAVDSGSHPYVTGWTEGGFPVTNGSTHTGGGTYALDAFITELNTTTGLIYSSYLGGNGDDMGRGIALARDNSGKVYVAGGTSSTNFPVTADPAQKTNHGGASNSDAFVAVIGPVADMAVTLTATNPAPNLSGIMTYTANVTNNGPDTATGVTLTLTLSSASSTTPLDKSNLSFDNNSLCTVDAEENFTCNLGSMALHNTTTLTFGGPLTAADLVTATATVSAAQSDTASANDTTTWTSTAGQTTVPPPVSVGGGPSSSSGGGGGAFDLPTLLMGLAALLFGPPWRGSKTLANGRAHQLIR